MRSLFVVYLAKWCLVASLLVIAVSGCGPTDTVPATGVEPSAVRAR